MNNPNVTIHALAPPAAIKWTRPLPFFLGGPIKVLFQVMTLVVALLYQTEPAAWLLVQNPPSIPTLAVARVACFLRGTRLLIDWHNYGWTVLAGTRGASHPFVRVSRVYERVLGRAGAANLTVTDAMARQLRSPPYSVTAPTLTMHDRPAASFKPIADAAKRRSFLASLPHTRDFAEDIVAGRTRLLVSSTSWTPDEDFALCLDALSRYATGATSGEPDAAGPSPSSAAPAPVLMLITGRGPQKEAYEARIKAMEAGGRLPGVTIRTGFLSFADYATLLACADLGVCLHRSSSGVDLPMKVVDMFGAGLPVAAYSAYESFGELVREGKNGCGFETAAQLAAVLRRLLAAGEGMRELARLRQGAVKEGSRRWDQEWDGSVGRVLGFVKPDPRAIRR